MKSKLYIMDKGEFGYEIRRLDDNKLVGTVSRHLEPKLNKEHRYGLELHNGNGYLAQFWFGED